MIQQKIASARKLWNLWHIDRATKRFIEHNNHLFSPPAGGGVSGGGRGGREVLCNLDFTCLNHIKFSYLMNVLAQEHGAVIKTFSTRPAATQRRLYKVYQSFNTQGYIDVRAFGADDKLVQTLMAQIWPITDKQALFDLKISNIWMGIDIYETYLRKCEQPTVNLADPKLKQLVTETVGLVLFWQEYFAQHKVKAIGMSIDGYTANNSITKIAQSLGIPVYTPDLLAPRIRDVPFAASAAFPKYHKLFLQIPPEERVRGIALAKEQLDKRLSGEVGVNMAYSTKSAWHKDFSPDHIVQASPRTKVLICSHDFVDAPHSHGRMLFLDFVEWLMFLAEVAQQTDYDWYIKLHADHDPASADVVKQITAAFPKLTIIPSSTSHHQLVNQGINVILTCYGSVGHEYPLVGIPVLNGGYNPHIAYSFNYHARSKEEYKQYLQRLETLKCQINPQDVYEFYYIHHYDELAKTSLPWWQEFVATTPDAIKAEPGIYNIWQKIITPKRHQALITHLQQTIPQRVHHLAEVR